MELRDKHGKIMEAVQFDGHLFDSNSEWLNDAFMTHKVTIDQDKQTFKVGNSIGVKGDYLVRGDNGNVFICHVITMEPAINDESIPSKRDPSARSFDAWRYSWLIIVALTTFTLIIVDLVCYRDVWPIYVPLIPVLIAIASQVIAYAIAYEITYVKHILFNHGER